MYQEPQTTQYGKPAGIHRLPDGAFIPFEPANTDYQVFKSDLAKGVELQDANGVAMTADQIATFLGTLP
jgi:hypothetical protein